MGQTINNGQSGAAWFFNKFVSENRKAYGELKDIIWGEPSKPSEAGKAIQQSAKARIYNDVEKLNETKPRKHSQVDNVSDSVAFSPEALALMG